MGIEIVTLTVGGTEYAGWKSFSATASAKSPERSFEFVGAIAHNAILFAAAKAQIKPGQTCTISANGDLIVTGYINSVKIKLSDNNHEIRVSGKSKGQDAVKSSVVHKSYEFKKRTTSQIAQEIDQWGIGFSTEDDERQWDKVRANPGETGHQFLGRLAADEGKWLCGQPDGSVKICKHGKKMHGGGLIEGDNVKDADVEFSDDERMNKVTVKGQRPTGTGKSNLHVEDSETDSGARKGRDLIIVSPSDLDKKRAKDRAKNAVDNRFGDSVKATVQVQGFRDLGGALWVPGYLVPCEIPSCDLDQTLAIESVTWSQDDGEGSMSSLQLVHPAALGGKNAGSSKSGNNWSPP